MNDNVLQFVIKAKDDASKTLGGFAEQAGKMKVAFTVAGAAIVAALGSTIEAATESQAEMARFSATLGTMGKLGRDAEEGLLKAADATLKLGFDNEESANSLAKLFQRTKDQTKAVELNNIAMDLARAKNISLSQASDMVGMVLSGNGKVLKQFGIDLKETKDPMEQLIELQKKVGGQAEAFAGTFAGQKEIVTQNIGEIREAIGGALLPVLAQLGQAVLPVVLGIAKWTQEHPKLFEGIVLVVGAIGALSLLIMPLTALITGITTAVTFLSTALAFLAANPIVLIIAAIIALGAALWYVWENQNELHIKMVEIWTAITTFLTEVFVGLVIMAKEKVDAVKTSFMNGFNAVRDTIFGIMDTIKAKVSEVIDWMIAKIQSAMAMFNSAVSTVSSPIKSAYNTASSAVSGLFGGARANGGPVSADRSYLVGENGPEMFIPNAAGRISPNQGGGGLTVIIQGNSFMGNEEAAVKIGDMITQRLGLLQRI
jgi:hypothetical protein